jgi:hypothetical protein
MNYAPLARILLRYLSGVSFGGAFILSERLAVDPDIIMIVSASIGAAVEGIYALAKKRGWNT